MDSIDGRCKGAVTTSVLVRGQVDRPWGRLQGPKKGKCRTPSHTAHPERLEDLNSWSKSVKSKKRNEQIKAAFAAPRKD